MGTPQVFGGHQAAVNAFLSHKGFGNAGLVWDRYLPLWKEQDREKNVYPSLNDFVKKFNGNGQDTKKRRDQFLSERRERTQRALEQLAGARKLVPLFFEARLTWRFATGLGNDHPTENGFSFEPTTGLPTIAAKAVKGLCRAAAPSLGWDAEAIRALFGPSEILAGMAGEQGTLFFFDAVPLAWPALSVDIANSHHKDYYADKGKDPSGKDTAKQPLETEDPNPVYFLALEQGARYLFPLLVAEEARARVEALLTDALTLFGAGAKTAAGYGRFSANSPPRASSQ